MVKVGIKLRRLLVGTVSRPTISCTICSLSRSVEGMFFRCLDACAASARLGGGAAEVAAPLPPGRLERLRALAAEEPEAVERVPGLAGVVGIV